MMENVDQAQPKSKPERHESTLSNPAEASAVPSLAYSSGSSASWVIEEPNPVTFNKPEEAAHSDHYCPVDEGCVTDRVVRFLCPFDTSSPPKSDLKPKHQQGFEHNIRVGTSSNDWFLPVQSCIPENWEGSPEQSTVGDGKHNIKNRCSTLEASKRKSDHIKKIQSQWHAPDAPVPLRSSRSEAISKVKPGTVISTVPSTYYDSDPEIQVAVPKYKKNKPLGLTIDTTNHDEDNDSAPFQCPQAPRHATTKRRSFFDSPRSVSDMPDLHNDDEVRAFIQTASEQKYKLIWHQPPPKNGSGTCAQPPPLSVTGWFEYGSQLDNHIVFPKFAWRQAFQEGFRDIARVPNSIQLLTIVSVLTPTTLDRKMYPFARLDRTCCIRTHDGHEFIFEASSERERDLFVKRTKVLVARLASSVIIHDEEMLQEFFSPLGTESFADRDDEMSVDCEESDDNNYECEFRKPRQQKAFFAD